MLREVQLLVDKAYSADVIFLTNESVCALGIKVGYFIANFPRKSL